MANELTLDYQQTGKTLYALLFTRTGTIWNGAAFEAPLLANWANYAIALTEAAGTGVYQGNMPAVTAGFYQVSARVQAGGSPAATDALASAGGEVQWDGSTVIALALGQVRTTFAIVKNTALANYEFNMVLSSDHVSPATGKTVTVQRSIDGGAYANAANTPATEVANGTYKISFTAADMNGTVISLRMTATGCDALVEKIITQG